MREFKRLQVLLVLPVLAVVLCGCGKKEDAPQQVAEETTTTVPVVEEEPTREAPAPAVETFKPPVKDQGPIFYVYKDGGDPANHWIPSGYMGDFAALTADYNCTDKPFSGTTCMKWIYDISKKQQNWAGCIWQDPENNWSGDIPNAGFNLDGAKAFKFAVRGKTGQEKIEFGFGGIKGRFPDTANGKVESLQLTTEWKEIVIPTDSKDMRRITNGFYFSLGVEPTATGTVEFYVDDVRFEF